MAQGTAAGLAIIDSLSTDARIADDYRLYSVRAHLLEPWRAKSCAMPWPISPAPITAVLGENMCELLRRLR